MAFRITALALLIVACKVDRTTLTLDVPPSAQGRIEELTVKVFSAGESVCTEFAFWATGTCRQECGETPPPDVGEAAFERTWRKANGEFESPELNLGRNESWEVLIVAETDTDTLYGCRSMVGGENAVLELWYPWCSVRACDRRFHPACQAEIQCGARPVEDPLAPVCVPAVASAEVWEQEGAACEPQAAGACRPAMVLCEEGRIEVQSDGVCPSTVEEPCVSLDSGMYIAAMDYDCDGAHPICSDSECGADDEIRRCGADGCVGFSECVDGEWGACTFVEGELCNGGDDDCDERIDEDSVSSCNENGAVPVADRCVSGVCQCGNAALCHSGQGCCDEVCVELATNILNCGMCGRSCERGQRCRAGRCVEVTDEVDGGGQTDDAGISDRRDVGSPVDCGDCSRPTADACFMGRCVCGRNPECRGDLTCCGGSCVDTRTSVRHCGGCDSPCGTRCIQGRCR